MNAVFIFYILNFWVSNKTTIFIVVQKYFFACYCPFFLLMLLLKHLLPVVKGNSRKKTVTTLT